MSWRSCFVLSCLPPNGLCFAKCSRFEFCPEACVNFFCLHRADLQITIVFLPRELTLCVLCASDEYSLLCNWSFGLRRQMHWGPFLCWGSFRTCVLLCNSPSSLHGRPWLWFGANRALLGTSELFFFVKAVSSARVTVRSYLFKSGESLGFSACHSWFDVHQSSVLLCCYLCYSPRCCALELFLR